jgi:hypothetical protein
MDCDMHERRRGNGPGLGLLLLIPVAVIIAKGHPGGGPCGTPAGQGPATGPRDATAFRMPPKIEWMLDTWHTRAHEKDQPAEAPTA